MITILDSGSQGNRWCEAEKGRREEGGHEECETERVSAGDMEEKGRWVPRVWEQGGTKVEVATQTSPADFGDHLW